jgi:hypothetical protein
MRFRYGLSVIIHFVILLCVVSQGKGETMPLTDTQRGVERITKPREGAGIPAVGRSVATLPPTVATLPPKQEEEERLPRQTLSSETENVLLLLLGIVLLLTFAVTKLGFSEKTLKKDDREPTILHNLKN